MKNKMLIIFGLGGIFIWVGLLGGRQANAVAAQQGITVSPAFQMVNIKMDSAETPVSFNVTNDRPVAQNLSFAVRDFNTLNESGGLFFVGTNPSDLQKKYGLAKWIRLSAVSANVEPHQTINVKAAILNLPDLSPGGHYGALMISLGSVDSPGKVGLQPIASSLLFVTKPQGATHKLKLNDVSADSGLFSLPLKVSLRFENSGNTHLVPRGLVTLKTADGQLVAKGIINQDSKIILPQTSRLYEVALDKSGSAGLAGQYKLGIDFRFDGIDQYRGFQRTIYYISPLLLIIIGLVIIVLAGWLLKDKVRRHLKKNPKPNNKKSTDE